MIKKIIKVSMCSTLLFMTNTLYAKESIAPKDVINIEQTKGIAEAYEMLETMHMDKTYSKMIDNMVHAQSAMLPAEFQKDKAKMEKFNKIMIDFLNKYLNWNIIREDMAKLYAKHYTVSELNDIKNFYLTATGQKSLEIMPQIMAESMQLTQSKIIPHTKEMQSEIVKLMTKK